MIQSKTISISESLELSIDNRYEEFSLPEVKFWLRSNFSVSQRESLKKRLEEDVLKDQEAIKRFIDEIYGNFSIIIQTQDKVIASVDKIRTYPLYIGNLKNVDIISTQIRHSFDDDFQVNEESWKTMTISSYTVGSNTLDKNFKSLMAGEFTLFDEGKTPEKNVFFSYEPWKYQDNLDYQSQKRELSSITLKLFENVLAKHKNKEILIPLSAGVDSRLIASGLKEVGASNVRCISYGLKNNFEANTARTIAQKLGYDWEFIELSKEKFASFKASQLYSDYQFFTESLSAVPFYQDVLALKILKEKYGSNEITIINGNSGDFISGGHILREFSNSEEIDLDKITDLTIKKHFSLWKNAIDENEKQKVRDLIYKDFKTLNETDEFKKTNWALFEAFEFVNRQSKYVISGQWNYDFYGFDWELPLWSEEYLRFWERMPYEFKKNQRLYKEMALENNWGNVWQEIPINHKTQHSTLIGMSRQLAKLFFAPLGRKKWHSMEKKIFAYYTEILGLHGGRSYGDLLFEKDEPRNILSWLTRDYLKELSQYGK